jgi:hypothetical protein
MSVPRRPEKTAKEIAEILAEQTGLDPNSIVVAGEAPDWTASVVGGLGTPEQQDEFARIAHALAARLDLKEE